jgi:hypothetical protein
MADRRLLTDRYLRALPPAPQGQRVEVFDARLTSLDWVSGPDADAGDAWQAARLWEHIRRYG